jgi:hypothetical protein
MMPSPACTRASAASISRYLRVRVSSDHTARIASLLKIPLKIVESIMLARILFPFKSRWHARRNDSDARKPL